ncbi:MAG: dipeptidase [Armatimonadota bacterium]
MSTLRVGSVRLSAYVLIAALLAAPAVPDVHTAAMVVDLHCDTLQDLNAGRRTLAQRSVQGHIDLPRLRAGGVDVQVFAVFVAPGDPRAGAPARRRARARALIETFQAAMRANAARITHVTTVAGIESAQREGKVAAVLSIENGDALGGRLQEVDELYRQGVRMMGLTWNPSNALGDGAHGRQHGGLTDLGRAVLRRMNELGMVVDLSHLSEAAFWDAMRSTRGPVIASHSNAAALYKHPRNLTDQQLREVATRGGVVGVNFYVGFLGAATLERVLDHIDHMVKVMGIDHVALGSDYDGVPKTAIGLEDVSKLPNLTAGLQRRGYTTEQIHKILGGNALRVFRQVWK